MKNNNKTNIPTGIRPVEKRLNLRLHFVTADEKEQFFQATYNATKAVVAGKTCMLYGVLDVAGGTPVHARVECNQANGKYYRITLDKKGKICRKCELYPNKLANGNSFDQIALEFRFLLDSAETAQQTLVPAGQEQTLAA